MFITTNNEVGMKNVMTMTAAAVCALALTACGGGGSDGGSGNSLSRTDEGIWSNFSNGTVTNLMPNMMQAVILNDGSFWGIAGQTGATPATFCMQNILHGTASVSGSSVSGSYTDSAFLGNGTYSGTVSAQDSLNLKFNNPSDPLMSGLGGSFNMSHDSAYNQPASLSAITGTYLNQVNSCFVNLPDGSNNNDYHIRPNLTISGSNLTLNSDGSVIMTGSIAPHGTAVNVFDVNLTTATTVIAYSMAGLFSGNDVPAGTVYKGILFQTSSGSLKNNTEMVVTSGGSAFFFMGKK